jgi:hypothetical protein
VSSLPLSNPRRTQRIAWLLHQDGADVAVAVAGADIGDLETCWVERESDRHGLDGAVRSLTWRVIEGSAGSVAAIAEAIRAAGASTLVAAGPQTLDGVLRDLVDLPSGTGRFRFIPGVPTTVQVLPDRAVLRHLNQGGALTP